MVAEFARYREPRMSPLSVGEQGNLLRATCHVRLIVKGGWEISFNAFRVGSKLRAAFLRNTWSNH